MQDGAQLLRSLQKTLQQEEALAVEDERKAAAQAQREREAQESEQQLEHERLLLRNLRQKLEEEQARVAERERQVHPLPPRACPPLTLWRPVRRVTDDTVVVGVSAALPQDRTPPPFARATPLSEQQWVLFRNFWNLAVPCSGGPFRSRFLGDSRLGMVFWGCWLLPCHPLSPPSCSLEVENWGSTC